MAQGPDADVVALDLRLAGGESDGKRLQGIHAVRAVSARYRVCLYTDERRRFVLAGRARGESFPQIASRLFISLDTAKDHMGP